MKAQLPIFLAFFSVLALPLRAEFLFDQFLEPSFAGDPNTEYSQWNVMFAPNGGQNYPDAAAPNGIYQNASTAGFSNPGDWSPTDPLAFWHLDNPTLTQTTCGHLLIGPGTTGNIYSFARSSFYTLADTTPYTLGTVVFQFQSEGTAVDFSSIKLSYDSGSGIVELAPDEFTREYKAGSSSFGGFSNRNAVQWDLTGLGVASYEITFNSPESSMSFQRALLDTAETFAPVVPQGRSWVASGSQAWSTGANWQQGSTSVANGNVRFDNTSATVIALDGDRTVAEFTIDTDADITLDGSSKLIVNTGITTTAGATGTTTINTPYELGAYNLMGIHEGTVELNGTVSGDFGMLKTGDGTLILGANNNFGSLSGGIGVQGGTLRIEGSNAYTGSTAVLWGMLEAATDAPVSSVGALGNAASSVVVGASSTTFSGITEPAQIVIDGDHTIARNISIEQGTFEKRLGAKNTDTEAEFSGNVSLLGTTANATNLKLFAQNENDVVRFSGSISGGAGTSLLEINADGELGTVVFSGNNKAYSNATTVSNGTLLLAHGTSATGNGAWSVEAAAQLVVDGVLGGTGTFTLAGELSGSGTVGRTVVTTDSSVVFSPGNSPGTLTLDALDASQGSTFVFELGTLQDLINVTGQFTGSILDNNLLFQFVEGPGLQTFTDYTLVQFGSSSGLDLDDFDMIMSPGFAVHQWTINSDSLSVSFSAIPEPSSLGLLAAAFAALLARRRLNRRLQS